MLGNCGYRIAIGSLYVLLAAVSGFCAHRAAPAVGSFFAQRAHRRSGEPSSIELAHCEDRRARSMRAIARVLVAAALTLIGCARGGLPLGFTCAIWSFAAAALLEADMRYEYLPFELNGLLLAGGIVVQVMCDGKAAAFGLTVGTALFAVTEALWLLGQRQGRQIIGGGDALTILATCAGAGYGCLAGAFAGCVAVMLVEGVRALCAGPTLRRTFPLGPYLMMWLVVGFAW